MKISGLTQAEVLESRKLYGENKLPEPKQKTAFDFFKETFENKLNFILLVLSIVFIVLAVFGQASFIEPLGIIVVLVAICIIDIQTGLRSQKNTKILKDKSSVKHVNVIRDNEIEQIDSTQLVVGDVAILQAGEAIMADGFLLDGKIKVNNSVLNGESEDCKKEVIEDFEYQEKSNYTGEDFVDKNSLFSGAIVTEGEGKMLVKKVGINTVNGQTILSMQNIAPTKTSLELQLEKLAGQISCFGYIGALLISALLLFTKIHSMGFSHFLNQDVLVIIQTVFAVIVTAITIIVAAVPEGLPLIINLITAQNAKLMLKHNVLAKNTSKIPEAGNLELLFTDKTGTLTQGKLTPIANILLDGDDVENNPKLKELILKSIALNTGSMFDTDGNIIGGNATDRAILSLSSKDEFLKTNENAKITKKLTFNSTIKYSAVETVDEKGKFFTFYKGAPEKFLKIAKEYEGKHGKKAIKIDDVEKEIQKYTSKSSRVIAVAYSNQPIGEELPSDLTMLSLIAIRDDIRPEAKDAVEKMKNAGVQITMITGDVIGTAKAIAVDVGIISSENDLAFSADEIESFSDEQIKEKLKNIKVIARATPHVKLRLVKIAQSLNLCVGMTGDGTNDAPALKASDVGFSMGSGTDLCKDAGDIIITDDNFVSITSSVLLGRTFMHNVVKFLKFQLPINVALVLLSILYPIFFGVEAVKAVQILVVNIVMDALVSLSFGGEPAKAEYMLEKPIKKGSALLSFETVSQISLSTFYFMVIFLITLIPQVRNVFFSSSEEYLTARFALLVLIANFNGLNIRTQTLHLFEGITKNITFIKIFIGIIAGIFILVTFGGKILQCTPLSPKQWFIIFLLSSMIIPVDMVRKIIKGKGR